MKSILGLIMATVCAGLYIATAAQAGALHDAVKRGDQAQVKRLLGDAANIDARARDGATPLIIAVLTRRDAVARLLIARGAGVNAKRKDGVTPLHAAARTGASAIAELLITKGAALDAQTGVAGRRCTLQRKRVIPMWRRC